MSLKYIANWINNTCHKYEWIYAMIKLNFSENCQKYYILPGSYPILFFE